MYYDLTASEKSFEAFVAPPEYYIELDDLLNGKYTNKFEGFLVIKNVFSHEIIDSLRKEYFSLFKGDYVHDGKEWTHVKRSKLSHGVGSHPSTIFVRSKSFRDFIESSILKKLSSALLHSDESVLCPRAILRSFSHFSSRCTLAHRDVDYFSTPDDTKVVTTWIPLGPADDHHGQLIYLKDSHKNVSTISKLVKDDRTISSDLKSLADRLESIWYMPTLSKGDIMVHCLNTVHASFNTNNSIPRLSCDLRFAPSIEYLDPKWSSYWRGDDGL